MGKTQSKNQKKKKTEVRKSTLLVILVAVLLLTSLCTVGKMPSFVTNLFGVTSGNQNETTASTETLVSNILFQDDFSNLNSGWETYSSDEGEVGYKDGVYFVKSVNAGSVIWGAFEYSFSDISIEVTATQKSSSSDNDNQYGIMCRAMETGGYFFSISGDGFYSIERIDNGNFIDLVEMSESDSINQGNVSNSLKVVCQGSSLSFYVNDDKLAEVTDTTYSSGNIALAAVTYGEEPTEIQFDNLVVTRQ